MSIGRAGSAVIALALTAGSLAACESSGGEPTQGPRAGAAISGTDVGAADFEVVPGVRIVAVREAEPGTELALVDGDGKAAGRGSIDRRDASLGFGVADGEGNLTFRVVPPGDGYEVRASADGEDEYVASEPFRVLDIGDVPDASFYVSQELVDGYQYIETRDGTTLATMVRLPGPVEEGPYPTVIEYSGYNPAEPVEYSGDDPVSVAAAIEEGAQPSSAIWALFGYAVVGVNMRGTGCSGGSYDVFDPASTADGYDVVETVAAQNWVADDAVGMVGISFPGITQLYTASTQPPSLAAITPLSVTDDLYRGTGSPGGIFNNGFAERWLTERVEESMPYGQGWEQARVAGGDETCAENQELRSTNIDPYALLEETEYVVPEWFEDRVLWDMVDQIEVPVFLAGAWQDEQTGGHFPEMLGNFRDDIPMKVTIANGAHIDSLGPQVLPQLVEFNSLYVKNEVPTVPEVWGLAPVLYQMLLGADSGPVPEPRFTDAPDLEAARRSFAADGKVRILFGNGAGLDGAPGAPQPQFEATFADWPLPDTEATTWYLGPDGMLTVDQPDDGGADVYTPDPGARPSTNLPGTEDSDAWVPLPGYTWEPLVDGAAVAYLSEPLDESTVMAGSGSVDVYLRSSAPDTDLQVTLSEVREDGEEVYIQSGWLRASHRALDEEGSTALSPRHTHRERDSAPMPEDEFDLARVPIWPFGHVFQGGSQIRVSVQAPGGDRQRWRFDTFAHDDEVLIEVGRSADHPSKVVLPVVPGVAVAGGVPPCPSLRGQPCRAYEPWKNRTAD
ncbi:MAG TPA: CocE/NonD family hydrolase [Acidimicrobiia bacterium]